MFGINSKAVWWEYCNIAMVVISSQHTFDIYGNVYFTWIESTRPKQMLRRPMAAITTRVRCSIFPSLSNNDDEEDDDDCWRLMMTKTTLHFWRLTHENQTGRKRSDWHTKISASERVTLTGAARLRTLVFWELRKVLITLKNTFHALSRPGHFTWVPCRWWRGPYSLFWTMGARISNSLLWQRCCVCCNTLTIS